MNPHLKIIIPLACLLLAAGAPGAIPDNFSTAQVLVMSGNVVSVTNNNTSATIETGEPGATGFNTLWYTWTAPATGEATITLVGSANFSIALSVWMGDSVTDIRSVVSGAPVTFPVVAGTVYYICSGSAYNPKTTGGTQTGNIVVNIGLNTSSSLAPLTFPTTAAVANDNFANRIITSAEFGSYVAYNGSATTEPLETTPGGNSLWWTYHAPANGVLDINDLGPDGTWTFGKYISVYTGTNVQSLRLLTPSSSGTDCTLPVIAGNDYQVCLSSQCPTCGGVQSGPIVLTFSLNINSDLNSFTLSGGAVVTNDNFNSAAVLSGATPAAVTYNAYATREVAEPSNNGYNTVWFKWTAAAAGSTQVYNQGSDAFNQYITVYTGATINTLSQVAQSSGGYATTAAFTAIAGQTYYISVGSQYAGQGGSIVLSLFGQPGTTSGPTLSIAPAFKLSFPTVTNHTYRIQQSADLQTWNSLSNVIRGNNAVQPVFVDPQGANNLVYRVTV